MHCFRADFKWNIPSKERWLCSSTSSNWTRDCRVCPADMNVCFAVLAFVVDINNDQQVKWKGNESLGLGFIPLRRKRNIIHRPAALLSPRQINSHCSIVVDNNERRQFRVTAWFLSGSLDWIRSGFMFSYRPFYFAHWLVWMSRRSVFSFRTHFHHQNHPVFVGHHSARSRWFTMKSQELFENKLLVYFFTLIRLVIILPYKCVVSVVQEEERREASLAVDQC